MFAKKLTLLTVLFIIAFISYNCKDRQSDKLSAFTKSIGYESEKNLICIIRNGKN
jgi:hypothetical protein